MQLGLFILSIHCCFSLVMGVLRKSMWFLLRRNLEFHENHRWDIRRRLCQALFRDFLRLSDKAVARSS